MLDKNVTMIHKVVEKVISEFARHHLTYYEKKGKVIFVFNLTSILEAWKSNKEEKPLQPNKKDKWFTGVRTLDHLEISRTLNTPYLSWRLSTVKRSSNMSQCWCNIYLPIELDLLIKRLWLHTRRISCFIDDIYLVYSMNNDPVTNQVRVWETCRSSPWVGNVLSSWLSY